ncbi:hypothetical protein [Yoonia sp. R78084]|uniref:hypothetical protein n=1 Tax=Yoonia sp. R78084 TaxID=3093869 RepID=UPI0037DC49CD
MQRLWLIILLTFIIGGHIAMWTSDMPRDLALRLTLINAAGWGVILIPACWCPNGLRHISVAAIRSPGPDPGPHRCVSPPFPLRRNPLIPPQQI